MQTHSGSTVALAWARLAQGHANEVAALLDEVEPDVMATGATSLQQRYVNTYFNAEFLALAHEDAARAMLTRVATTCQVADGASRNTLVALADGFACRIELINCNLRETIRLGAKVIACQDAPALARLHAWSTTGEALAYRGMTQRSRIHQSDLRELATSGDRTTRIASIWADTQEVLCLSMEGRVGEATAIMEAADAFLASSADAQERALVSTVLGAVYVGQGRAVAARRPLLEALNACQNYDPAGLSEWASALLAQAEALLGNVAAAKAAFEACHAGPKDRSALRAAFDVVAANARLAMAQGRTGDAAHIFLEASDRFGEAAVYQMRAFHEGFALGAPTSEVLEPLQSLAAATEAGLGGIYAAHVRAFADKDAQALEVVVDQFARFGLFLEGAEAAAQAAALYSSQALRGGAARMTARSRGLAEHCPGVRTPLLAELDAPVDLSRREREVATLAARGLANRAIADELSVSIRTVESHLYQAFAKLGVDQRGDLAAILAINDAANVTGKNQ